MSGLYLHIPFCRKACTYCDFHFSTNLALKNDLVNALCMETELMKDYLSDPKLSSIYFGGGTPSLLSPAELENIFNTIQKHFTFNSETEITLEANPDDINTALLKNWLGMGFNRLSIGLQSFNNEELRWMNRAHNAEESVKSVKLSQDAGFDNITIDLIYGSRFQSEKSWEKTLLQAIDLNTQHISSYNLTIEERTKLSNDVKKGTEAEVSDELSSRQFEIMTEMLSDAGFIPYEISNFGKPGFFAVHNSNYWKGKEYLGLGPSAHSYNGTSRKWNVRSNSAYINNLREGKQFFETEILSEENKYNEYVLTRLRTIWGCNIHEMRRLFSEEQVKHFLNSIKEKSEFIEEKDGIIVLNRKGKLQADGIASDLFI